MLCLHGESVTRTGSDWFSVFCVLKAAALRDEGRVSEGPRLALRMTLTLCRFSAGGSGSPPFTKGRPGVWLGWSVGVLLFTPALGGPGFMGQLNP